MFAKNGLTFTKSALMDATSFDPYTHGYYRVGGRIGKAFKDGLSMK